jgi:WD40 repeat protein
MVSPSQNSLGSAPTTTPFPTPAVPTYTPLVTNTILPPSQTPDDVRILKIEKRFQWSVRAILDINWAPNSEHFAVILERSPDIFGIQLFSVDNKKEVWFTEDNAHSVVFSPSGDSIITTSTYYGLREFDVIDGSVKNILDDPYNCLGGHQIVTAESGKTVFTGYSPFVRGSTPHTTNIFQWVLASGQCVGEFITHEGWLRSLLINPENQKLVTVIGQLEMSDNIETMVWEIETKNKICSFDGVVVAFEPNGDLYATSYNKLGELNLWDITNCSPLQTLNIVHNPISLAISPDGKLIATGENSIKIWDASSGDLIHEHKNIPNEVQQLAFSPDGIFLSSVHPAKNPDDTASLILWEVNR